MDDETSISLRLCGLVRGLPCVTNEEEAARLASLSAALLTPKDRLKIDMLLCYRKEPHAFHTSLWWLHVRGATGHDGAPSSALPGPSSSTLTEGQEKEPAEGKEGLAVVALTRHAFTIKASSPELARRLVADHLDKKLTEEPTYFSSLGPDVIEIIRQVFVKEISSITPCRTFQLVRELTNKRTG